MNLKFRILAAASAMAFVAALGLGLPPAAKAAGDDIKIGVILGFTGPIESLTPGMADSAELAMKEVSDSGLLLGGRKMVPIRADSTCVDASAAVAAAERLISSDSVAAIVGALGVPLLAARTRPWVPMAVVAVLWLSLPLGLLLAPDAYVLWSLTGGVAQGGGFTAIFSIIARMAGNDSEAASGSAFVQTGGYLAATIAPPFAGWLHTATDGWTAPVLLVLAATLAFTTAGLLAARSSARPPGARQAGADPA